MIINDYEKVIFKMKDSNELMVGYYYVHQAGWDYPDQDDGKRFFTYGQLSSLECIERISPDDVENLDIEWKIKASEIKNKFDELDGIFDEIVSLCICDHKRFSPILEILSEHKKTKLCDTCKKRKDCGHSEEWECTKYYPPKYYERGNPPEYRLPNYGKSTSELLSDIMKTGEMPKTEWQKKQEEKRHSSRSFAEAFPASVKSLQ